MEPMPVPPSPDGGNEPWWAAAGGAVVGLILVASRAYFWIRGKLNSVKGEERKSAVESREEERRAAAAEAWTLNARLMEIIQNQEAKDEEREQRYKKEVNELKIKVTKRNGSAKKHVINARLNTQRCVVDSL